MLTNFYLSKYFTEHEITILIISVILNLAAFIVIELIRRVLRADGNFTRKGVHIAVSVWACWAYSAFHTREMAIVLPLLFILAYLKPVRMMIFRVAAIEGDSHPGMLYLPAALLLLFWFCWDFPQRWAAIIGLLNMGFGDPLAAIIGVRYGTRRYQFSEAEKSYEGSFAMFAVCLIVTAGVLFIMKDGFSGKELISSASIALGATALEALCGRGLDNLSVPLGSAVIFAFFYL